MQEDNPLKLTEFQKKIFQLVRDTPQPGKWAGISAERHLARARDIRKIDPEMSVFHAITAEEEAATALFHSLKRRKYLGARALKHRDHVHKAAVKPFFDAVVLLLGPVVATGLEPELIVQEQDGGERVLLRFTIYKGSERRTFAYPDPPLHFRASVNEQVHDFTQEIEKVVSDRNVKSILAYVRGNAYIRNQVLYASTQGLPHVESPLEDYLRRQLDKVIHILIVYLLVDPYDEHQDFVQQCLNAFLKMLGKLPEGQPE